MVSNKNRKFILIHKGGGNGHSHLCFDVFGMGVPKKASNLAPNKYVAEKSPCEFAKKYMKQGYKYRFSFDTAQINKALTNCAFSAAKDLEKAGFKLVFCDYSLADVSKCQIMYANESNQV